MCWSKHISTVKAPNTVPLGGKQNGTVLGGTYWGFHSI